MSFDAGGLAQMTYQPSYNANSIGVSGPGFASKGKGAHIKRLSVAPPPKISTIDETQAANHCSTPRTARGHLLAGLRTQPKSATVGPATGLENSRYGYPQYNNQATNNNRVPQTTTAAYFPNNRQYNAGYQNYSAPEQVLAPPSLDFAHEAISNADQTYYDELVATNAFLAQQQRALQQQLLNVQMQMGGLNVNGMGYNTGMQTPVTPMNMYNQQFSQLVQPVPGNAGMYQVYNPMTGQTSLVYDNSFQQDVTSPQARMASPVEFNSAQRRSPPVMSPVGRSVSPPKHRASPPAQVEPLPPPSANAFRPGHRKGLSSVNVKTTGEWTRPQGARAGLPATPMTGTFGPGQARAGEHPVRQPRNPPHLTELQEKPTSKHEGSKNFATRQRRRAVHDLVRAGRERMSDRNSNSDSGTPGSEVEFNFSVSSDDQEASGRSGKLSSKPSSGSLAAIGSERKEKSRERDSIGSAGSCDTRSIGTDEGSAVTGKMVDIDSGRRRTPLLVLSSAEKRRSIVL